MPNPWFRMYNEFSHDPKVQMMSEAMQRRYIMLMCMRCSNALETLHETEMAFHLRISDADLAETKALFLQKGFIDEGWQLLNWDKRQFASDSSKERVKQFRDRKKRHCNGHVTVVKRPSNALDTDTDTEAYTDLDKRAESAVVESIYQDYHRKIGKKAAREPIKAAIKAVAAGESGAEMGEGEAATWLREKVRAFARSPAGNRGNYTAHPATWFRQGRYLDDPAEWEIGEPVKASRATVGMHDGPEIPADEVERLRERRRVMA